MSQHPVEVVLGGVGGAHFSSLRGLAKTDGFAECLLAWILSTSMPAGNAANGDGVWYSMMHYCHPPPPRYRRHFRCYCFREDDDDDEAEAEAALATRRTTGCYMLSRWDRRCRCRINSIGSSTRIK